MSLSIVPTVTAARSVSFVLDGGVPPYVVDASPGGDRPDYRIRSQYATVVGVPARRLAVDGDVPLNTPTVYVVTDSTGAQAQTAPVTVSSTVPVLSDATDPGRALDVVIVSQKPNRWEARSVWWDILGSSAPFASIAPMRNRSGTLVIRTSGQTGRAAVVELFRPGNPLTLRAPSGDAVDDLVILVESVDEELVLEDDPAGPVLFSLAYQSIARELGPFALDPGRSYAAVLAESATYAVTLSTFPSYDALRVGDPGADLGPELVTGGDFSSGLGSFSTSWTTSDVAWDTSSGTARATKTGAGVGAALIASDGLNDDTVTAGTSYRISGRVRASDPGTTFDVQFLTNTAPDTAAYFSPGLAFQDHPTTIGPLWSTFSVDFTVPAGDDRAAVWLRWDGIVDTAVVELDDLSIRAHV